MYYTRREQPLRLLCWYAMNGFATIVGSLFAYGIGHINSSVPLWKFPFLICGAISTAWSICLWFLLPSNPTEAWFLSKEERIIALARVKDNQNGVEAKVFKKEQAIEALKDPKVWLNAIGTGSGNILGGVSAVRPFPSFLLLQSVAFYPPRLRCSVAETTNSSWHLSFECSVSRHSRQHFYLYPWELFNWLCSQFFLF